MITINIASEFSEFPGLRHYNISDHSGEVFYHSILNPKFAQAYQNNEKIQIDIDSTAGYASSFLDEAFGNLVYDFTLEVVLEKIIIISEQEPHWKEMILNQTMPEWEKRRKNNKQPKVTKEHQPWYRLVNKKLILDVWEKCTV